MTIPSSSVIIYAMQTRELTPLDWKTMRVRAGLNQTEAAELIGVSQSELSRFEQGQRQLPEALKIKLLKVILNMQTKLGAQ